MSRLERIVAAWGGLLFDGGRRALVRAPGHGPGDRSVSLVETEDGRLVVHCFSPKENWRDIRDALRDRGLLGVDDGAAPATSRPAPYLQPAPEDRAARARRIWSEARPLPGSAAELYLHRRSIRRPSWNDEALRCHLAATGIDDRVKRPALIAAIRDSEGARQGVQITLLTRHGERKAQVATPRRIVGGAIGGAVQLDDAAETLLVAEGVETALSASAHFSLPAWALLSAHLMANFVPPAVVQRLVVAADNDAAGRTAAASLALRLRPRIEVEIVLPPDDLSDWNDAAIVEARTRRIS